MKNILYTQEYVNLNTYKHDSTKKETYIYAYIPGPSFQVSGLQMMANWFGCQFSTPNSVKVGIGFIVI